MVILDDGTNQTESDDAVSTTATEQPTDGEPCECEEDAPSRAGLGGRLMDYAEKAATLLKPFSTLFSAIVQAATVYTLVRKA